MKGESIMNRRISAISFAFLAATIVGMVGPAIVYGAGPAATPPLGINSALSAREFSNRAETAFKSGDYQGAAHAWLHSLVDDPRNGRSTMMLGQSLFAMGNFGEAAGATQAAMRLLPKDKWGVAVANYKELYGKNLQDYTDQLRALEKGVTDNPNNPALRFLLGFQYAYLGFPKEAVDQLNRGLAIEPRDAISKELRDEMQAKLLKPEAPNAKSSLGRTNAETWIESLISKIKHIPASK